MPPCGSVILIANENSAAEEKAENRLISGIRVLSEYAIAGIKRFRSTTDVYRNKLPNMDDTFMLLSAGLWNYHLAMTSTR
ncbi:hypothetical protein HYV22_02185 [Candidatus Gottesmanbacteria bacterium]|nr:hypothetical protein [Candidatus Gottesmanbacteria bacterium]